MGGLDYADLLIIVTALEQTRRFEVRGGMETLLTDRTLRKMRRELGKRDRVRHAAIVAEMVVAEMVVDGLAKEVAA